MLSSGHWHPDEDGEYFIDRNPKFFSVILEYLRKGKFDIKGLAIDDLQKLQEDLDYYQIATPFPAFSLGWCQKYCGKNILIEGKSAKKYRGENGWNAAVLGDVPNLAAFKFKIVKLETNTTMLGISPKIGFKSDDANHSTCGYYLYLLDGTLYSAKGDFGKNYTAPPKLGSVIELFYEKQQKTISFVIDGIPKGIAFSDVELDEWYPAAEMYYDGCSVEILL